MSNYETVVEVDGKWVRVWMIDNYYGRHEYGVRLPSGTVVHTTAVKAVTPLVMLDEIERLQRELLEMEARYELANEAACRS